MLKNNNEHSASTPITTRMWGTVFLIASQSFVFGYAFASLNPCLAVGDNNDGSNCFDGSDSSCPPGTIYNNFNLSSIEVSLATGLIVLGCWFGSLCGSYPSDKYGRRATLLMNALLFVAGAALSATGEINCFFIGRFVSGVGVGVISGLSPLLLSEIADDDNRGVITTMVQLLITLGIFVVSLVGYGFVSRLARGWQYVLGLQALPALCLLALPVLAPALLPESPCWLARQGRLSEALATLTALRPEGFDCISELNRITASNPSNSNGNNNNSSGNKNDELPSWGELLKHRKALIIGCGLMFFQCFTGVNSVIFYSTTIFGFAGFDEAILATASVNAVNFLSTIFAVFLIDRVGRRKLLLVGQCVMLFSLILLAVILLSSTSAQGVVAVLSVLVYQAGFAVSLGSVVWVVMSEIMASRLRAKAMALFLSLLWASNLVIALGTLPAIDALGGATDDMTDDARSDADKKGVAKLYFIFMAFTVASLIFTYFYIPETKGMNPEEESISTPLLLDDEAKYDEDK